MAFELLQMLPRADLETAWRVFMMAEEVNPFYSWLDEKGRYEAAHCVLAALYNRDTKEKQPHRALAPYTQMLPEFKEPVIAVLLELAKEAALHNKKAKPGRYMHMWAAAHRMRWLT